MCIYPECTWEYGNLVCNVSYATCMLPYRFKCEQMPTLFQPASSGKSYYRICEHKASFLNKVISVCSVLKDTRSFACVVAGKGNDIHLVEQEGLHVVILTHVLQRTTALVMPDDLTSISCVLSGKGQQVKEKKAEHDAVCGVLSAFI